jgi:GntR family transcriptional repressor for pyruvate dehydrogenase complex
LFKQVNRVTIGDNVLDQFVESLNSGIYKLGEKLPPETEMCEQFRVSRPVLREVLRTLRFLGFLETVQGGGTYISKAPLNPMLSEIKLKLALEDAQIMEVWELRYIIEVEIAGLAAARATEEEIENIQKASDLYENHVFAGSSDEETISSTQNFHNEIARAAHNAVLMSVLAGVSNLLTQSREYSIQVEGSSERASTHHRRIANAIADHNVSGAKEAMRQHLIDVQNDLLSYMQAKAQNMQRA